MGVTDQRVLLCTVTGLEAIERRDVRTATWEAKNYGGARELWGHVVHVEFTSGRRLDLDVIDRGPSLPPEHDVSAFLARLRA